MSLELISLETIEEFARTYGYSAVLLGILLENLGLPLPGESIVVVGGFLAGRGDLNYWGVLACSVSGAIAAGLSFNGFVSFSVLMKKNYWISNTVSVLMPQERFFLGGSLRYCGCLPDPWQVLQKCHFPLLCSITF
jgi:hypothetical protein